MRKGGEGGDLVVDVLAGSSEVGGAEEERRWQSILGGELAGLKFVGLQDLGAIGLGSDEDAGDAGSMEVLLVDGGEVLEGVGIGDVVDERDDVAGQFVGRECVLGLKDVDLVEDEVLVLALYVDVVDGVGAELLAVEGGKILEGASEESLQEGSLSDVLGSNDVTLEDGPTRLLLLPVDAFVAGDGDGCELGGIGHVEAEIGEVLKGEGEVKKGLKDPVGEESGVGDPSLLVGGNGVQDLRAPGLGGTGGEEALQLRGRETSVAVLVVLLEERGEEGESLVVEFGGAAAGNFEGGIEILATELEGVVVAELAQDVPGGLVAPTLDEEGVEEEESLEGEGVVEDAVVDRLADDALDVLNGVGSEGDGEAFHLERVEFVVGEEPVVVGVAEFEDADEGLLGGLRELLVLGYVEGLSGMEDGLLGVVEELADVLETLGGALDAGLDLGVLVHDGQDLVHALRVPVAVALIADEDDGCGMGLAEDF